MFSMVSHCEALIKHQITRGHNMAHEYSTSVHSPWFARSLVILFQQIVCIFLLSQQMSFKNFNNAKRKKGKANVSSFEVFNNTTIFQNIKCLITIIPYNFAYNWFLSHLLFKQLDEIFYESNINMTISKMRLCLKGIVFILRCHSLWCVSC